jgi:hypothetical protein
LQTDIIKNVISGAEPNTNSCTPNEIKYARSKKKGFYMLERAKKNQRVSFFILFYLVCIRQSLHSLRLKDVKISMSSHAQFRWFFWSLKSRIKTFHHIQYLSQM